MWFPRNGERERWGEAEKYLSETGREMRQLIERVGPCTLRPRRDYFVVLCKAIFSQQLSSKVAAVLFGRFRDHFPARRPTPARVLEFLNDPAAARAVGLSRQKQAYVRDLAMHFASGEIPTRKLASMGNEEVIEALVRVNGIGRWTAEMFLIFTLNRPDVWPVDDLGVRKGAQRLLKLKELPSKAELLEIGERWKPYRSIASWYLWRQFE